MSLRKVKRGPKVIKTLNNLIQYVANWARLSSLWSVHFETGCCCVEFMAVSCSRYDWERFGTLPISSPRQNDLLVIEGIVSKKMAKRVKHMYDQLYDPKYVIALGNCSITGALFKESYSIVKGIDKVIPVDVFVPGCPPRPEAQIHALRMLQEKIRKENLESGAIVPKNNSESLEEKTGQKSTHSNKNKKSQEK